MTDHDDIIAVAPADAPEMLDAEALDSITGGAYGGHNSCEPYSGDNTCEQPARGRATFQTLPIKRPSMQVATTATFKAT